MLNINKIFMTYLKTGAPFVGEEATFYVVRGSLLTGSGNDLGYWESNISQSHARQIFFLIYCLFGLHKLYFNKITRQDMLLVYSVVETFMVSYCEQKIKT